MALIFDFLFGVLVGTCGTIICWLLINLGKQEVLHNMIYKEESKTNENKLSED